MQDLITRPRRLRATPAIRDLVAEARIDASMLVQPHFVVPGKHCYGLANQCRCLNI